jgi:hypothetical protein
MESEQATTMETISAIAQEAFIYGYPMVDLYSILYKYVADPASPEYKAPLNRLYNTRRVATAEDRAIVAPNCDTPYSYAWLDLRAEPVVISIPPFAPDRYVSLMLSDLYTYIFGYVTPRTNGNAGGDFLIAGPAWAGSAPAGIKGVYQAPTQLALAFFRTQLFGAGDLPAVRDIQDQFRVQPLSAYLGAPPPPPAPALAWIEPLDVRKAPTSLRFFAVLSWMLRYMPELADEHDARAELAALLGTVAAQAASPDATTHAAVVEGMQAGQQALGAALGKVKSSGELFGSREFLGHNYLSRAVGAMVGILGNSAEEYLGIGYAGDADGQPFDGSREYRIKFTPATMPPVRAFWSITVYDATMLLYANPLDRYVINAPMVDGLLKDADGGFTLYAQHTSPGAGKETNWLPTPGGKFNLTFRAYQPEQAILDFIYHAPPVVKVK